MQGGMLHIKKIPKPQLEDLGCGFYCFDFSLQSLKLEM